MGRAASINRVIESYDYKLFCEKNREGKLCVYRQGKSVDAYDLGDGRSLLNVRSTPHFVFALTHNWKESGYEVDWGIEPIMARLKAIDLWQRDLAGEIELNEERLAKSLERDRHNSVESFLYDFRSQFQKTFNDVRTCNMRKIDKRKSFEKRKGV